DDLFLLKTVCDRRAAVEAHHDRSNPECDQDGGCNHSSDLEYLPHDSPSVASGSASCLDFFRSLGATAVAAIGGFRDVRAASPGATCGFSVGCAPPAHQPGKPPRSA